MAQRPCALTWSCRPFTSTLIFGSFDRTAYGKTYSSGSTSSLQNSSTQSSFFWHSGSVEKSHAIARVYEDGDACTPVNDGSVLCSLASTEGIWMTSPVWV